MIFLWISAKTQGSNFDTHARRWKRRRIKKQGTGSIGSLLAMSMRRARPAGFRA
jgi:frataxin-like iron-binding protein CyaY